MAARKLCRETQLPSKALYFFPWEGKTGIAPTHLIVEKKAAAVGVDVTINWQGGMFPLKLLRYHKRSCKGRTFFHKIETKNQGCGLSTDRSVFGVLKNLINIHKTSQDSRCQETNIKT